MFLSPGNDLQVVPLHEFQPFLFENDFKVILPEVRPVRKEAVYLLTTGLEKILALL